MVVCVTIFLTLPCGDHMLSSEDLSFAGPGKIKRREVSWTITKKLDTFASPGEIKRREVSWTLTKKLDTFASPGEIKRREVSWTLKLAQKRSRAEVELGSERWTSFASVATQQQCYGHCLCDSAPHSSWDSNHIVHQLLHNGDGTLPQHFSCSGGGPRSPWFSR